jgi:arylsulfatase A-like enzyme
MENREQRTGNGKPAVVFPLPNSRFSVPGTPFPSARRASGRTPAIALAVLIVGLGSFAAGCRPSQSQVTASTRPSVLLITVDALRADRLSGYGYAQQTPHIDSLARDGVLFEHAVCDVPWTTGSMASVFTGQYASHHRLRLSTERLSETATTLAEVLRGAGYTTAAIIGSFPLASIYGLNKGFELYDEDFTSSMFPSAPGQPVVDDHGRPVPIKKIAPLLQGDPEVMRQYFAEKVSNDAYRPDDQVTDRAIAWLVAHRDRDLFLWVHYFGPHERLNLFQTWQEQSPRVIADYDRDLAFTDAQIGRLLSAIDQLGLRERLLVVLHADHGQSLGENQYVGHGDNLYQPSLHIPLLMRMPGRIAAGLRVPVLAQNVDIFPTILALLSVPSQLPLSGSDLSSQLGVSASQPAAGAARVAYSETFVPTIEPHQVSTTEYGAMTVRLARFGLLRGDRMYVRSEFRPPCARADGATLSDDECQTLRTEELYAPFADPQGAHNLAAAEPTVVAALREQLDRQRAAPSQPAQPIELSPGQKEKLRALGYGS